MAPFLMNLAASVVNIIMNNQLVREGGDLAIGAFGIINSFGMLIVMCVLGLCQGMQPIVGFNYGAGKHKRVKDVLLLTIRGVLRRWESPQCFGRRLPEDVLRNAAVVFTLYLLLFLGGGFLICMIDGVSLMGALFESASAIGTVGLSLVGTATLSAPSRAILIFLMYFGRVGGLTLICAVFTSTKKAAVQYPQESVTVG